MAADAELVRIRPGPALIRNPGRRSGVPLALNPLGARALLGVPAGELAEWDFHAEDVLGRAFAAGLARSVGWSTRHLSARFLAVFGVGPKAFGRLVRFRRAAAELPRAAGAGRSLAEIAAAHG
jgi:AraC-like DNA-binding protein